MPRNFKKEKIDDDTLAKILPLLAPITNEQRARILAAVSAFYGFK